MIISGPNQVEPAVSQCHRPSEEALIVPHHVYHSNCSQVYCWILASPQYGSPCITYVKLLLEWCHVMEKKVIYIYIVSASVSLERQRRSIISQRAEQLFEVHLLWWHYSFSTSCCVPFQFEMKQLASFFKIGVLGPFNVSLMGPFITGDEVLGTAVGQDDASLPINSHPWTDPCGIRWSLFWVCWVWRPHGKFFLERKIFKSENLRSHSSCSP